MSDAAPFRVAVSAGDGTADVRLFGELDMASAPELLTALGGMLDDGIQVMTLDLSALDFIDSSGLSALVRALGRQREKGGDLVLKAPTPSTHRVLEITGLIDVFTVVA